MPEHVPNTVLYNKNLEPPNNLAEVPDSNGGRISGEALIAQDVGWAWVPLPDEPPQGEQPKAVEFVPATEAEAGTKTKPRSGGKTGQSKEGSE